MLILRCLYKPRAPRCLFGQHLPHQIADKDDLGIGDLIECVPRAALYDDNASIAQRAEVPGDCRLRLPVGFGNIPGSLRTVPQDMDDFDPCGAGHTPAKVSLASEDRAVEHVTLPKPARGPIGRPRLQR
jgi:hypothetical protein